MDAMLKDLGLHAAALHAATDRGETVVIHVRVKPRAVLSRWEGARTLQDGQARNPAFGLWANRDVEEVEGWLGRLCTPRDLP